MTNCTAECYSLDRSLFFHCEIYLKKGLSTQMFLLYSFVYVFAKYLLYLSIQIQKFLVWYLVVFCTHPYYFTDGIAGICSFDGRHLALMPHPERSVFSWQWPYTYGLADGLKDHNSAPWMQMFYNAYEWCSRN